ncbi:MAG: nucleoside 2-deoxyribosyltransferase, partial [Candidatus Pacearchaeota archaeon]
DLEVIVPRIEKMGLIVFEPFRECGQKLQKEFQAALRLKNLRDRGEKYQELNMKIGDINNRLMEQSDCLLAILDGGHSVDDGVASEIGYFAGLGKGPIFALRSDFRAAENTSCINAQVHIYIMRSGGKLVSSPNHRFKNRKYPILETWFYEIQNWLNSLTKSFKE